MKIFRRTILALSSSVILSTAWYEWGTGLLLLIGLVPFLILEEEITDSGKVKNNWQVYLYAALSILLWNIIDTWWIKNASFAGLIAALMLNSVFMPFPLMFYSMFKSLYGRLSGYASLVVFWLAFEFASNHGEISWAWLSLGNGFMYSIQLIQWYEYTGIFGGTLWVLLINVLIFELYRKYKSGVLLKSQTKLITTLVLLILIPSLFSIIKYHKYTEEINPREVVVVQPSIDAYLKFKDMPSIEQTKIQVNLAEQAVTDSTAYVVCPETSITGSIWIDHFDKVDDFKLIDNFTEKHANTKYVTGIMCAKRYISGTETKTARPLGNTGFYYDTFNSAVQFDTTPTVPIYHKSMLVTGVEKMPYTWLFKPLKKLMLELGGIFRTHGTQENREVFSSVDDTIKIAPVICYESVYGEFVGDYIKEGAHYIFVITNDGWWGNTPGHRQHNALSSLRAIETRRSVARSANTGISCVINQRGDVMQKLAWMERDAIRSDINANSKITFYVKYGDYIGRSAFYLAIVLLLLLFIKPLRYRLTR